MLTFIYIKAQIMNLAGSDYYNWLQCGRGL